MELIQAFRKKLQNGGFVIGPFSKTIDPAFIEAAGFSGFDFIILDMEHGPTNVFQLQNLVRAAQIGKCLSIVRIPFEKIEDIGRALDIGAAGVQIPQITNKSQALDVVRQAKFFPMGDRGVCRYVRAANYSTMDRQAYFQEANETIVILQIEGKEALKNIESIAGVRGIDIIFFGPYDLSQSLGIPGQVEDERVITLIGDIQAVCKANGIVTGVFVDNMAMLKHYAHMGIQYLSYSVDVGLFAEYCSGIVKEFRLTI